MENEYIKLVTVCDEIKYKIIIDSFTENQVRFFEENDTDFIRMVSNFDVFEKNLFVLNSDYKKADSILKMIIEQYGNELLFFDWL